MDMTELFARWEKDKSRIAELEGQLTALREAARDYLDGSSVSTHEVLVALLEVSDEPLYKA